MLKVDKLLCINKFKILIFLEKLYKSREIPNELYYLVETFIKKAKKWLGWSTTGNAEASPEFFRGGNRGVTARKAPTQGVRWAKAQRTVVKFHF